jgi:hypothetical protein
MVIRCTHARRTCTSRARSHSNPGRSRWALLGVMRLGWPVCCPAFALVACTRLVRLSSPVLFLLAAQDQTVDNARYPHGRRAAPEHFNRCRQIVACPIINSNNGMRFEAKNELATDHKMGKPLAGRLKRWDGMNSGNVKPVLQNVLRSAEDCKGAAYPTLTWTAIFGLKPISIQQLFWNWFNGLKAPSR